MRSLILAVAGLALSVFTACSSGNTAVEVVPDTPVASVSLTLPSPTLVTGQTQRAIAIPRDADGAPLSDRTVTWQSASPSVASVDASGMIAAVAPGTVVITASSEGVSAQTTLTVIAVPAVPVASVSVTPPTSSLQPGATVQLIAVTRDGSNNVLTGRVVTWTTGSPAIASVTPSGLVTANGAGTTSITASSEGKTASASISVTPVPVASVTVTVPNSTLAVGATMQAVATLRDANNNVLTGRTVTWASGIPAFATVSGTGLVTGVAGGTTAITASSGGIDGSANVTVVAQSATTVFSDDFESGNMSKWNESNSTTQQVINDPASAHSGSRFLRLTYGINGEDAAWLNKYFYQGYTQVYVRYYVRFSSNFTGGTKLVGFHGAPIGSPALGLGRAGICPNGSDSFAALLVNDFGDTYPTKMYTYWQDMWADGDGRCWGRYGPTPSTFPYISPMPNMTKNVWHKIEYTVKMNSAANVADGEQRFWVDGVKYGEWKGIRSGDPSRINIGVLIISGSGSTAQIQTVDYDDLILTTDYPSQSQP